MLPTTAVTVSYQDWLAGPVPHALAAADPLWVLASLASAVVSVAMYFAVRVRQGQRQETIAAHCLAQGRDYHLPPTIEAAEREIAVLLRRMRAYLRDPYDFGASRITCEAGFEECLDRAAALGDRIAELGGAAPGGQAERERARGLILDSLLLGRRLTVTSTQRKADCASPLVPARPSAKLVMSLSTEAKCARRPSEAEPAA